MGFHVTYLRKLTTVVLLLVAGVMLVSFLCGCTQEAPPPPKAPPAPEDLSTWAVPELVQPPTPPAPTPLAPKDKPTSAEEILDYTPGTTYPLSVPVNAPLDIVLARGEQVRNIIGGDQALVEVSVEGAPGADPAKSAWAMKEGAHGVGETLQSHLFLTVTKPGLTAGFIVTTTQRTYYLTCKSVKTAPHRVVRWRYPIEQAPVLKAKEPGLLPDPTESKRYHVGYELTAAQKQPPDFLPRHVVDDGKKMYIVFPEITLFETAPLVRMIGPNGPALINARQFLNVLIIDQLAPRLELRVGLGESAEVVQITRGALRTIQCPDAPECPVWPRAAQVLAAQKPVDATPPQGDHP